MLSMIEKRLLGVLCLCLFLMLVSLAGCGTGQVVPVQAQQGGGLLSPTPSQINSKNGIVDSATALTQEITGACNAQAQVDYNWLVGFCGNGANYTVPTMPVSVSSNIGTQLSNQGKAAWCQSNMYTGPSGQLIVPEDANHNPITPTLNNCPSFLPPAPVTAPTGASAAPAAKS